MVKQLTRSAWRIKGENNEECGDKIKHHPKDGAKSLSKKMIDTIKEQ